MAHWEIKRLNKLYEAIEKSNAFYMKVIYCYWFTHKNLKDFN